MHNKRVNKDWQLRCASFAPHSLVVMPIGDRVHENYEIL